jgi:CO/xanthine dehydrogenase Mo-binding subunit
MSAPTTAGQPRPRLDARAKVRGEYPYGMDFSLPGLLHACVLRSPHAHARIARVDTRAAEALPGVRAVLTGRHLGGRRMPGVVCDQPLLAGDRVRYVGEPVAAVAATSFEIAAAAARLIEVDYEPQPIVTDAEAALQPGAPLLHPDWASYQAEEHVARAGNVSCHATLRLGDAEAAFAEADVIVEGTYATESVHQAHVEPRVAVGVFDADSRATVYSNTQLPYWIRTNVAHVLDLPEGDVRIVPLGIGGAFGSKLYPQIEPLVALLARQAGRPVRLMVPLEDELLAGLPRHPSRAYLKTGVRRDGTLVARQARLLLDTGAYAGSGPEIAGVALLVLAGPYRTPHLSLDVLAVMTNKTNFGAYRGPGGPQAIFALESHLDEVAERLGLDPLELRLRNILQDGDTAGNGQRVEGVGLRECLEKAAAAIDWGRPAGPHRGKGLACGWWTTTGGLSMSRVRLDPGGKVVVTVGTQEIGTGAIMGGVPQVVAEALDVPLDDVRLVVADTSSGLWDFGSQGSRTLFNVGRAAGAACAELAEAIKTLAEKVLEVPAADLVLKGGFVVARDNPSDRISLADLVQRDITGTLQGRGQSFAEPWAHDKARLGSCLYPAFHYPSFHCHAAEVEVDPGTGEVTVLRYAAAHDIGFAVNPRLVEGQIHGGVAQGIGMGLMEELVIQGGRVTNTNWTDYKLPTVADVPDIQAIIVQHPVPGGPFGAKGLGESPVLHPPAALANAVRQAAGVRLRSLPLTAEKILDALQARATHREEASH